MAASATPKPADTPAVAVAFSGGLDSTALLHATVSAASGSAQVLALHVHHGLQAGAEDWAAHCSRQAAALGAGFQMRRLPGRPPAGESTEAWARAGRHAALHEMATAAGIDLLLLAHHRRDQAETFLLQALRGAGTAGLAGMPRQQWRSGLCWARPWLDRPREQILAYAQQHGLRWLDDPSNADPRFARNRLRQALWPAFGAAEAALAQSARWAGEAHALAQELAGLDLDELGAGERLDLRGLLALSPARASNALRGWLALRLGQPAPASLVQRLLREASPDGAAAWPAPGGQLRSYRGGLHWVSHAARPAPPLTVDLSAPGCYPQAAWQGAWWVQPASPGLPAARLTGLLQCGRHGGEQFQRAPGSVPRSLKKAWQEAGLPAWRRQGPLLWDGAALIAVASLGMDARALVDQGLALQWVEDPAFPQAEGPGQSAE